MYGQDNYRFYMNYWLIKLDKNNKNNLNIIFLYNNFFSWSTKNSLWQCFFLGFYFDELFSKILKNIYVKFLSLPGYFFVDRWFSNWIGMKFFNNFLNIFNNFFFFEKLDFFFYFISLLNVFFFFIIYLFLVFFFFL